MLEKIKKIDPWYALFWAGITGIFIWALLKSFRIIQSPPWQEMLPIFMALAAAIGIAKYIVKYIVKIEVMDLRLHHVEDDIKLVKNKLNSHNQRLTKIDHKLGIIS